jgi:alpha-D-ribose 1-methylphosphonate 5-triphosphate diphosphatase
MLAPVVTDGASGSWSAGVVVTPDEVLRPGTVIVGPDGRVDDVAEGTRPGTVDLGSATVLMPGAVDLHCDAVEKLVEPRPGVRMPLDTALEALDRRMAAAGITTAYAALSLAGPELGLRDAVATAELVAAIVTLGSTRTDHRVHLRVEVTDTACVRTAEELIGQGSAEIVSLMDHTPGRGQFTTLEAYVAFHTATSGRTEADVRAHAAAKEARGDQVPHLAGRVANAAKGMAVPLACHDPDSRETVDVAVSLGAVIAEFPTTLDAARHAHAVGVAVAMGSPNILRGRSSSGNVAAGDVLREGSLDLLVSDYYPEATWPAAFSAGLSLRRIADLVAGAPARAAGLIDRGELSPGRRADFVAVDDRGRVTLTVRNGRVVA